MATVCAQCSEPLEVTLESSPDPENHGDAAMHDDDDDDHHTTSKTVPDDVHLPCGDHFHWECLLSAYELSRCPKCSADITSHPASGSGAGPASDPAPQILVDLTNEGGTQRGLDIFPLLQEESYLRAYPDERKARAFLELCREGDHRAVVGLLQSCNDDGSDDDDDDGDHGNGDDARMGDDPIGNDNDGDNPTPSPRTPDQILRYQDPIGSMQSGLHAAVANGHREVAWLLLLLASELPELEFPALVYQEAAALGIMREDQGGKVDIRSLRDARGRTAEDVAREEGGVVWNGWVGNGRLALP